MKVGKTSLFLRLGAMVGMLFFGQQAFAIAWNACGVGCGGGIFPGSVVHAKFQIVKG